MHMGAQSTCRQNIHTQNKNKNQNKAGELAWQVRACLALPQDTNSGPSTQAGQLTTTRNSREFLFWIPWAPTYTNT